MTKLANIEFFRFEDEMWARLETGTPLRLNEECRQIVAPMYDSIESIYTDAHKALSKEYREFSWNIEKFQFRIVDRFIRCNFGSIDNVKDIDTNGYFCFEHVECPLRGICQLRNVVCNPKVNSGLGRCEEEVLRLTCQGLSEQEIAEQTGKEINTVHNQKFRGYRKLGVHNAYELADYTNKHNLFRII